ncbi:MAG: aminotransferase class IV [Bacillota bacterium]
MKVIYEVIRIIDKKPLFLKEHIDRLVSSLKFITNKNIDVLNLKKEIKKTIKDNNIENQNIKVEVDENTNISIFPIKSNYPDQKMYDQGIDIITINKKRINPNIKLKNNEFKSLINKKIKEKNVFEALLVDENGKILEGSRSNIIFIKGDTFFTSKSKDVLEGITMKNVIKTIKNNNLKIKRKDIYLNELKIFDGAFLTGTSIDILPINKIEDFVLNSSENNNIKKIIAKFKKVKKDSLRGNIWK